MIRTVSRYARKACMKGFLRTEVVFERKIVDFPFKNNFGPIDFLPHVFFFVEKKQCVPCLNSYNNWANIAKRRRDIASQRRFG